MTDSSPNPESIRLFDACVPRREAAANDNYAADLHAALGNEIASIDSARDFFQSTYPTSGLREICRMIFSRLANGDASGEPSLYRLDSRFGGGKTHTLIALAALAKHPNLIGEGAGPVPADSVPDKPVRLVAFTGENFDLVDGANLGDRFPNVRPKSLIGHIAVQLGGQAAFDAIRAHDKALTAPGSEDIAQLLGDAPCLILLDELVQMLRRYEDDDFRDKLPQLTALFSALAKAVETSPRSVLVLTSPDPAGDAYGDESARLNEIMGEIDSVLARTMHQSVSSNPDGSDLPRILRRRLFSDVSDDARERVADIYAELLQRSSALIAPPPQDVSPRRWFSDNYPFHPDTLTIITDRLTANPNFQRTRGTLRLLARTVRHMETADRDALLIHPHHIDPASAEISGEMLTRLDRSDFHAAISADIIGANSTADRIDETRPTKPARRIARAVLLASLSPILSASGLSPAQIVRAALAPSDDDPSVIANAVTEFRNRAFYVNDNPNDPVIRFTTVPSLNRILRERGDAISSTEIKERIADALTKCFSKPRRDSQDHLEARIFPSAPDIPDSPDAVHLGVINYEWLTDESDGLQAALADFYRNSPLNNGQAPRQFKNNIAILVADSRRGGDLETSARRDLAARQVRAEPPDTLQDYQKENLEAELSAAERDLNVAIQKLYVNLYYPSTDDPISAETLFARVRIPPDDAADSPGQGQNAIIKTLQNRSKLLTRESANLDGKMYWSRRPNLQNGKVRLADLKEEFARAPGNYMLLNASVADALLRNALSHALTIKTGSGQIIATPQELVRTDDPEAVAYLKANACDDCFQFQDDCRCQEPKVETCPKCGKPKSLCNCEDAPPDPCPIPGPQTIPDFESGFDPKPLNVLAADLLRHAEDNDAAPEDIAALTLMGDGADFINFIASMLGQNVNAAVAYKYRRDSDGGVSIEINGMAISEWSRELGRFLPRIESVDGLEWRESSVTIAAGDDPGKFRAILAQMPPNREAAMTATFKQKQSAENPQ